uniref:Trafficking protein particle complex subunit 11 domain-containing protein n=1 Tax=Meloidogyne enterolobii TaxID=390850 RepID=A0A6V7TUJ7_MELEN|nr:unnamed protein product [Meloidogyne enterolobii]
MEPKEIDSRLINNCLRGLIFFNGLELNGKCAHHEAIFNAFTDLKRERSVQCQYKILNYGDDFFKRNNSKKTPPNDSISIKNKTRGIIKYNWQYKYLDERPALIVLFIDLDWDSDLWLQQKNECESRLNVLRQSIGQLETKLALVLIQKAKTTVDDSIATEKAIEICQFCKISTRQFYVFPLLTDKKATAECIVRLEIAFYQIAQEAYQAYFKKIRARSVPNNDQQVLLRQQFKLAFISELREDRHSSLRYYKQAYQIAADLEMLELSIYELINIAGFLNYKICELNFILNSPLEALNQFRKHSSNFFNRQMGNYPSKELAIIEFELWKSQQNRLFADLFNFAVSNGVAAYASQNPGRFLEEAASHLKRANSLIRQLKTKNAHQQRQSCSINLDLNAPTIYFGHRPWLNNETILAEMKGNLQLVEHAAKIFLEQNIQENYSQSIQLFSAAIGQFKRYHCKRFATLSYLNIAEEYICFKQFGNSLQILQHVSTELRTSSFYSLLRNVLVLMANCAYCSLNINEWILAIVQLLHSEMTNLSSQIEPNLLEDAQNYFSGHSSIPFPILPNSPFYEEEICSIRPQWEQNLSVNEVRRQQNLFQLELSQLGNYSFLNCKIRFLPVNINKTTEFEEENENKYLNIRSEDSLPIEVLLKNNSCLSLNLNNCTIYLEQISSISGKTLITLDNWSIINCDNKDKNSSSILLNPNQEIALLFILKPKIGKEFFEENLNKQQNRAQSPSSGNKNIYLDICIRSFAVRLANGCFIWENVKSTQSLVDNSCYPIENSFIRYLLRMGWIKKKTEKVSGRVSDFCIGFYEKYEYRVNHSLSGSYYNSTKMLSGFILPIKCMVTILNQIIRLYCSL